MWKKIVNKKKRVFLAFILFSAPGWAFFEREVNYFAPFISFGLKVDPLILYNLSNLFKIFTFFFGIYLQKVNAVNSSLKK